MKWTKEQTETLIKMRKKNCAFSEIAEVLGMTRSAVAGKVSRTLGRTAYKMTPVPMLKITNIVELSEPYKGSGKLFHKLKAGQCKFAVTGLHARPQYFCGKKCEKDYCKEHAKKAYVKKTHPRDRNP